MENYNFELVKKEYENKKILIEVDLSMARMIVLDNSPKSGWLYFLLFIGYLLFPIVSYVLAFINFGLFKGLVFTISMFLFSFSIYGMLSININKTETYIYYFSLVAILVLFIFGINTSIPFFLILLSCLSIDKMYSDVFNIIVNDFALKDSKVFEYLIKSEVISIRKPQ